MADELSEETANGAGLERAMRTEEILVQSLQKAGLRAERFRALDRKWKVDVLVESEDNGPDAHPRAEIQVTLDFDNREKIQRHMEAKAFTQSAPVLRIYLELWSPDFAWQAAQAVKALLKEAAKEARPRTRFLRIGPRGRSMTRDLAPHVGRLSNLCSDAHGDRTKGTIMAVTRSEITVLSQTGATVTIPIRCLLDQTRWQMRVYAEHGELPQLADRGMSFLPGHLDESGFPVFCAFSASQP